VQVDDFVVAQFYCVHTLLITNSTLGLGGVLNSVTDAVSVLSTTNKQTNKQTNCNQKHLTVTGSMVKALSGLSISRYLTSP